MLILYGVETLTSIFIYLRTFHNQNLCVLKQPVGVQSYMTSRSEVLNRCKKKLIILTCTV